MEEEQEEAASAARRALADAAFASKELEAIKEHAALMAEQLQTAKIVASKAVLQETKTALRLSAGHPRNEGGIRAALKWCPCSSSSSHALELTIHTLYTCAQPKTSLTTIVTCKGHALSRLAPTSCVSLE